MQNEIVFILVKITTHGANTLGVVEIFSFNEEFEMFDFLKQQFVDKLDYLSVKKDLIEFENSYKNGINWKIKKHINKNQPKTRVEFTRYFKNAVLNKNQISYAHTLRSMYSKTDLLRIVEMAKDYQEMVG